MSKFFWIGAIFILFGFSQPSIQQAQNLNANDSIRSTEPITLVENATDHDRYQNLWAAINFGNYPGFDSGNFIKSCP